MMFTVEIMRAWATMGRNYITGFGKAMNKSPKKAFMEANRQAVRIRDRNVIYAEILYEAKITRDGQVVFDGNVWIPRTGKYEVYLP
jgi:hypothetical protein